MKPLSARRLSLRMRRRGLPYAATASTSWADSTHAEVAWDRARAGSSRWAWAGAVSGALIAVVCFAPARWLAEGVSSVSGQRVQLAEARGSVWSGSAVLVLTGGPGSRDAAALPGRLSWTVRPRGWALEAVLRQACCLHGDVTLRWTPTWGGHTLALLSPPADWIGQWPGRWLAGLGTPWNTLRLGGTAWLRSGGLSVEAVQGRWQLTGELEVALMQASSRLSTLDTLGSYRLTVQGAPLLAPGTARSDAAAGTARITLSTLEGALQLSGLGSWGLAGLHFQGEARAADANDTALDNLLNIIGQRDGARSVISIG